ncbi:MAG TPA: arginase family protein [Chryseolinea sp.]
MRKKPDIQIVTASSILGLRPTGVERLAEVLLSNGLQQKLNSANAVIDVPTLNHLYSSLREPHGVLNAAPLTAFSKSLKETLSKIDIAKKFVLVLGGDCSILIGIMAALRSKGTFGLFFMDAHADFYEPEKSITGEAADMELAIVTGRGPDLLVNIDNLKPYVHDENVIHIGQRDMEETRRYGSQEIRSTGIKCIDLQRLQQQSLLQTKTEIDDHVRKMNAGRFWIHFDTDVIGDMENPAVDYRIPGGLSFKDCQGILNNLIQAHPTIGMSVTIFNPDLDSDEKVAKKIADLISNVLS